MDEAFPRSFMCCITDVKESLRRLPHPDVVLLACDEARRLLAAGNIDDLDGVGLHQLMDRLQFAIGPIHEHVMTTYVRSPAAPQAPTLPPMDLAPTLTAYAPEPGRYDE